MAALPISQARGILVFIMQIKLDPKAGSMLSRLRELFARNECRGFVVGGFVRDLVLGRPVRDIDIVVEGDAVALGHTLARELNAKLVLLDDINDVVRLIVLEPDNVDWQIDLSAIHHNLDADLGQRDLTLNAMAIDIALTAWDKQGVQTIEIIDPLGGLGDINKRAVRATGDGVFRQDALRLLRAVRLAAELDFKIENSTETLIRRDAVFIQHEAGERVREELIRILRLNATDETLLYLQELGLLTAVIPELAPSVGLAQHHEHQWDVFRHSARSVLALDFLLRCDNWPYTGMDVSGDVPWSNSLSKHFQAQISSASTRRELVKLAALLHDVAKPQTRTVAPNGRLCFYGHPEEGAVVAENVLERLRFSTRENKLVTAVVRYHLRPVQMSTDYALPTRRAAYRFIRDLGDATIDTLLFSLADHLATRGEMLDLTNWHHHANIVAYVLSESARMENTTPVKLINGYDLQRVLGLKPGAELGEILAELREAQAVGEISNRDDALNYANRLLIRKHEGTLP